MQYLEIKNWKRFQHYSDRNPPWIKLHYEILTSPDWVMVNDASKLLAVVCMMLADASTKKSRDRGETEESREEKTQKPDSVSDAVWNDFLILRKGKKAPVTSTVIKSISNEALKAGITLETALSEACSRGWQSFKAEWYNKPSQFEKPKPQRAGVKTL